mmetsp:Transcript_4471/g.10531  ORF Transcript_4471/g.10531 Transcript_4471/m.10531 type:complete len:1796 (+) Transcript_4471:167-5554(+)
MKTGRHSVTTKRRNNSFTDALRIWKAREKSFSDAEDVAQEEDEFESCRGASNRSGQGRSKTPGARIKSKRITFRRSQTRKSKPTSRPQFSVIGYEKSIHARVKTPISPTSKSRKASANQSAIKYRGKSSSAGDVRLSKPVRLRSTSTIRTSKAQASSSRRLMGGCSTVRRSETKGIRSNLRSPIGTGSKTKPSAAAIHPKKSILRESSSTARSKTNTYLQKNKKKGKVISRSSVRDNGRVQSNGESSSGDLSKSKISKLRHTKGSKESTSKHQQSSSIRVASRIKPATSRRSILKNTGAHSGSKTSKSSNISEKRRNKSGSKKAKSRKIIGKLDAPPQQFEAKTIQAQSQEVSDKEDSVNCTPTLSFNMPAKSTPLLKSSNSKTDEAFPVSTKGLPPINPHKKNEDPGRVPEKEETGPSRMSVGRTTISSSDRESLENIRCRLFQSTTTVPEDSMPGQSSTTGPEENMLNSAGAQVPPNSPGTPLGNPFVNIFAARSSESKNGFRDRRQNNLSLLMPPAPLPSPTRSPDVFTPSPARSRIASLSGGMTPSNHRHRLTMNSPKGPPPSPMQSKQLGTWNRHLSMSSVMFPNAPMPPPPSPLKPIDSETHPQHSLVNIDSAFSFEVRKRNISTDETKISKEHGNKLPSRQYFRVTRSPLQSRSPDKPSARSLSSSPGSTATKRKRRIQDQPQSAEYLDLEIPRSTTDLRKQDGFYNVTLPKISKETAFLSRTNLLDSELRYISDLVRLREGVNFLLECNEGKDKKAALTIKGDIKHLRDHVERLEALHGALLKEILAIGIGTAFGNASKKIAKEYIEYSRNYETKYLSSCKKEKKALENLKSESKYQSRFPAGTEDFFSLLGRPLKQLLHYIRHLSGYLVCSESNTRAKVNKCVHRLRWTQHHVEYHQLPKEERHDQKFAPLKGDVILSEVLKKGDRDRLFYLFQDHLVWCTLQNEFCGEISLLTAYASVQPRASGRILDDEASSSSDLDEYMEDTWKTLKTSTDTHGVETKETVLDMTFQIYVYCAERRRPLRIQFKDALRHQEWMCAITERIQESSGSLSSVQQQQRQKNHAARIRLRNAKLDALQALREFRGAGAKGRKNRLVTPHWRAFILQRRNSGSATSQVTTGVENKNEEVRGSPAVQRTQTSCSNQDDNGTQKDRHSDSDSQSYRGRSSTEVVTTPSRRSFWTPVRRHRVTAARSVPAREQEKKKMKKRGSFAKLFPRGNRSSSPKKKGIDKQRGSFSNLIPQIGYRMSKVKDAVGRISDPGRQAEVSLPYNVHHLVHVGKDLKWTAQNFSEVFELKGKLGEGAFGTVWKATHREAKFNLAIKLLNIGIAELKTKKENSKMNKADLSGSTDCSQKEVNMKQSLALKTTSAGLMKPGESHNTMDLSILNTVQKQNLQELMEEIEILKQIRHPRCVAYYGSHGPDTNGMLWIMMDLCDGGSVMQVLEDTRGQFTELQISYILSSVTSALMYLHKKGIIHRDIKGNNILLTRNGDVKLADFGVSHHIEDTMRCNQVLGSPLWLPPEAVSGAGTQAPGLEMNINEKADIWSLAITAIEIAEGEPPYSNLSRLRVLRSIALNPPPVDALKLPFWSSVFNDWLATCLVKDPKKRPSAEQIMSHPFLLKHLTSRRNVGASLRPIIGKSLYIRQRRIIAEEAKNQSSEENTSSGTGSRRSGRSKKSADSVNSFVEQKGTTDYLRRAQKIAYQGKTSRQSNSTETRTSTVAHAEEASMESLDSMDGSVVIHGSHSELNVDRSLGRMKSELYQSHSKQRGVNTPRSKPTSAFSLSVMMK